MRYNKSEDLKQFYRRICAYVEITKDDVSVYNDLDERGRPTGFPTIFRNKVSELKSKPRKNKTNFAEAFGAICDPIPFEEVVDILNSTSNSAKKY